MKAVFSQDIFKKIVQKSNRDDLQTIFLHGLKLERSDLTCKGKKG